MSNNSDINETPKRERPKKTKETNQLGIKKRANSARKNRRVKLEEQRRQVLDNSSSTTIATVLSDLADGIFLDSSDQENDSDGDNILTSTTEIKLAPPSIQTISSRQYVEQKTNRKFSTFDIEDAFYEEDEKSRKDNEKPVKAAVAVQKFFTPFARLCCGLLGGVSLWQCLTMWQWRTPFIYSYMEFIPDSIQYLQSLFYLLGTVSLISALDSCDFGELNRGDFPCCYPCRKAPLIIGVVLVATILLSLLGAPLDEHLVLSLYNNKSLNYSSETDMITWDVGWWETLNAARSIGGITAWVLFSLLLGSDTLQIQLLSLIGLTKQREEAAKESEKEDDAVK